MTDAVIVAAARTAIGTSFKGTLRNTSALDLADVVVGEVVQRSGLDPALFDEVIMGEVQQGGGNIARHAAITSGLLNVSGLAVQRQCASSLSAIQTAAASIMAGMDSAVIAGGAESVSTGPSFRKRVLGTTDEFLDNWMPPSHPDTAEAPNRDMTITVGWNTAQEYGITREEMDAWAYRSHMRALAGIDDGRFVQEIVPFKVTAPTGEVTIFEVDEHPRRATTLEKLASLKSLHQEIDGFSITAGNSSGVNDAATAVVVTSDTLASQQSLAPLAVVRSWASVGVDPVRTGSAPIYAIEKALKRAGLTLADIDLFEINEAFASVPIAVSKTLKISEDIINVSGSGCSLGHPVAATGARMAMTLINDLRRTGGRYGIAALCAGGGMGSALLVERV
ncbi:MAG: putative acetyl-CoA acyltransferase [Pseudonocardiales bacterium]|nr:putative acetyl-CoA acyltransferase [Pseudonocardiales bacterium]